MRYPLLILGACLGTSSFAADVLWSNITNFPNDLMTTGDGWSATRAEDIASYRIAADDVLITTRSRINAVNYFSIQVGNPDILGGDFYVYEYNNGVPGALISAHPNLVNDHYNTGWFNTVFNEPVYGNKMPVTGLELEPGRYFFAMRTVENRIGGQKNGVLSTRTSIGTARAQWNFGVLADGSVFDSWVPMSQFNLVENQEWAFQVHGAYVTAPSSATVNFGKLNSGNVGSLAYDDNNAYRVCLFLVPNQQVAPVTVQLDGTAPVLSCTALTFSMKSRMVHGGSYSQTLDLFNWSTNTWDTTDTRTDALTTSFATNDLNGTGTLSRLLRNTDGAVRARYRVRQTGPTAITIWCHDVEKAVWYVTP